MGGICSCTFYCAFVFNFNDLCINKNKKTRTQLGVAPGNLGREADSSDEKAKI